MSAPDAVQLCVFTVGPQRYALDILRVEELLPPQPVTALPRAPAGVAGVVEVRGAVLPVVDLRRRLGGAAAPDAPARLMVCRVGRRRVALAVERVVEVLRVGRDALRPAPALGERPFVVGVHGPPERRTLLLDVRALLRAPEEAA